MPERIRRDLKKATLESDEKLAPVTVSKSDFSCLPEAGEKLKGLLNQFEDNLFNAITFREGFDFELFNTDISNWRDDLLAALIEKALEDTYGNQVKAAELLKITPRALRYHLQKVRKKEEASPG